MRQIVKQIMLLSLCLLLAACTAEANDSAVEPAKPPTPSATETAAPAIDSNILLDSAGLTFRYDPILMGNAQVQEIAATANQGMFEQPTPAHTWIGFVPGGIQRDFSNHWVLQREPQIIFFNLNDFGSFAASDEQARQKIALFQQLLADRPDAFSDEIPVLPSINAAQMIRAQVEWLDFSGGAGVRFVTAYSQDSAPVSNDQLMYVFFGMTHDRSHGVTVVFPLMAAGLPETGQMSVAEDSALSQNYAAEMTATTAHINGLGNGDFDPSLFRLDALVQSITVPPLAEEYVVVAEEPRHGQVLVDTLIYSAPGGDKTIATLKAGEPVVINGSSSDGRRSRILCPDGTTRNCWVAVDAMQVTSLVEEPVSGVGMPGVGQVVQIAALSDNSIHAAASDKATLIGVLRAGEAVEVFGSDETGAWLNVACPRGIAHSCWVAADPAINQPTGFFAGDGWQEINTDYVSFRVPADWEPTALTPGYGSVLVDWHLGIPGLEGDQTLAFFVPPFETLMPGDLVSEYPFEIGGQPGSKWVRAGEGYVSYDYYTTGTGGTVAAGAGSFGIHITIPEADPDLESLMDMLAASVVFNK